MMINSEAFCRVGIKFKLAGMCKFVEN